MSAFHVARVDADGELVRVVGRQTDQAQDFARTRVEHHRGAVVRLLGVDDAEVAEAVLGGLLEVGVDRQLQRRADLRRILVAELVGSRGRGC